jgi:peptidoglycan/LPS O-acetylase OafA/YrhL
MTKYENFLLSLGILFPFILGLIRYSKIGRLYRPFIALIAIAVLTEIVNYVSIQWYKTNTITINIYSLAEYLLIIFQFYYWRYHSRTKKWYPYLGLAGAAIWIVENLVVGDITHVGPVFRVSSAFMLVILSINEINYLIVHENRNLLKNARFLICAGFLIYFLYQILLEGAIYIYLSQKEKSVTTSRIIQLSTYINLVVNIIYGIAVWFIPRRTIFNFKNETED